MIPGDKEEEVFSLRENLDGEELAWPGLVLKDNVSRTSAEVNRIFRKVVCSGTQ